MVGGSNTKESQQIYFKKIQNASAQHGTSFYEAGHFSMGGLGSFREGKHRGSLSTQKLPSIKNFFGRSFPTEEEKNKPRNVINTGNRCILKHPPFNHPPFLSFPLAISEKINTF